MSVLKGFTNTFGKIRSEEVNYTGISDIKGDGIGNEEQPKINVVSLKTEQA